MNRFLSCFLLLILLCIGLPTRAAVYTLTVNSNGTVAAPANFWTTNSSSIYGVLSNYVAGHTNFFLPGTTAAFFWDIGTNGTDMTLSSNLLSINGGVSATNYVQANSGVFSNSFQLINGAVNGWALVSDGNGVGTWQAVIGTGGTNSFSVNGTILTPANLLNSSNLFYVLSGSNVLAVVTNIDASKINSGILPYQRYRSADNSSATLLGAPAGTHGLNSITLGNNLVNSAPGGVNVSSSAGSSVTGTNGINLFAGSVSGYYATAIQNADAAGDYAIAIGLGAAANQTDAVALGHNATTTRTNQFRLGASGSQVVIPGDAQVTNNVAATSGTFSNSLWLNGDNLYSLIPSNNITFVTNGNRVSIVGQSGAQVLTNANNSFSSLSSNTFNGPVRFTTEPLNSSLIFDCVVKETSGYVSSGSTALKVTGGNLSAANIGNTIQVWQPDQTFMDAYITNGTAILVSTNANFTFVHVGKIVEVSGASNSYSFVTTISSVTDTNHAVLAGNASTTVQGVPARIVSTPFVTTIAGVSALTNVTLTAAPTITHTNANVVYGTDNRAAFASDCAIAQLNNRALRIGPGKAMVVLSTANPWAMALSTNSLTVVGAGRDTTTLVVAEDGIPSVVGGLFRVDTSGSFRGSDFTIQGYTASPFSTTLSGTPVGIQLNGGGGTQYLATSRLDIFGMAEGTLVGSGSANDRYQYANDCKWVVADVVSSYFVGPSGNYERRMRDCYFENTKTITTRTDDTSYNDHVVYDHPPVSEDWADVTLKSASVSTAPYLCHKYGGPGGNPAFLRFERVRCLGTGSANGFLFASSGGLAEFINPVFEIAGVCIAAATDVTVTGGRTRGGSPGSVFLSQYTTPGSVQHFRVTDHDYQSTNALCSLLSLSQSLADVTVKGGYIYGGALSMTGGTNTIRFSGTTFVGLNPPQADFFTTFSGAGNSSIKIDHCKFQGTVNDEIFRYQGHTNLLLEISDCISDIGKPLFHDNQVSGNGSMAWGQGNVFNSAGGEPISDGRLGSHFVARRMLNPTSIASASTISPSFNFDSHHVTGSTTIDTILVGGSAARNLVAYEITLVADAGATWATSSAGNIVPLSTIARTAGRAYTFRWDSIDQKWREVGAAAGGGTPGGAAPQFQINTNGVFGGVPGFYWQSPFLIISNGNRLLFSQTNPPSGNFNHAFQENSQGLGLYAYSDDLTASTEVARIVGSVAGPNSLTVFGDETVNGTITLGSNITAQSATISKTMTHNGPVVNASTNLANSVIDFLGPPTRIINLSSNVTLTSTNETSNTLIRIITFQAASGTNTLTWSLTGPTIFLDSTNQTSPAYMPTNPGSVLRWTVERVSGTNQIGGPYGVDSPVLTAIANLPPTNNMAFGYSNGVVTLITAGSGGGVVSGNVLTNLYEIGPIQLPISADSTNIDWATNANFSQGYTATGDFTNVFQNVPPNPGSQIQYTVNNTTAAKTNITCWFGPASGGNAISNNVYVNLNLSNAVSVTCPPGITRCEWGYNGNRYFLRTTKPDAVITAAPSLFSQAPPNFTATNYNAFGIAGSLLNGTLYKAYKSATNHISGGSLMFSTSKDGGSTWVNIPVSSTTDINCNNVAGGTTPNGRVVLFFTRVEGSTIYSLHYTYSDDNGATWSTRGTLPTNSITAFAAYGGMIPVGSNQLAQTWYGSTLSTNFNSLVILSSDNGTTWGNPITISTNIGTLQIGETSITPLGGSYILALARENNGTTFRQFLSTNNCLIWTDQGDTSFDAWSSSQAGPAWLRTFDRPGQTVIQCVYQDRTELRVRIVEGYATNLIVGPSGWDGTTRYDLGTISTASSGYPTLDPFNGNVRTWGWYHDEGDANQTNTVIKYFRIPVRQGAFSYTGLTAPTNENLDLKLNGSAVGYMLSNTNGTPVLQFRKGTVQIPNFSGVGYSPNVDTNTIGMFTHSGVGGFSVSGFSKNTATEYPLALVGLHGSTAPTVGAVVIYGFKYDGGNSRVALANGEPLADFSNGGTQTIRIYGDGGMSLASAPTDPGANSLFVGGTAQYKLPQLTKTSNYSVSTTDVGKYFNNTGAGGAMTNTLPTAAAGLHYYFYVDAAQQLTVQASGSDTIRYAATVSAAAGNIYSSAIGSTLHVFSPKAGVWIVDQLTGVFTGPQ